MIGSRLKMLRAKKKVRQEDLGKFLGVGKTTVSQYESGTRKPDGETLKKIAAYFDTSTDYLLGLTDRIERNSVDLPKDAKPYEPSKMLRIPVLGTIRAGQPIDRLEMIEGYELVEPELLRGRTGFVLRVQGDSMIGDRIFEGDRVVVVAQNEVNPIDIAVVAVNGCEATLKRVKFQDGMAILSSSNPAMEALIYPAKDVFVLGKVIEVRHSLE